MRTLCFAACLAIAMGGCAGPPCPGKTVPGPFGSCIYPRDSGSADSASDASTQSDTSTQNDGGTSEGVEAGSGDPSTTGDAERPSPALVAYDAKDTQVVPDWSCVGAAPPATGTIAASRVTFAELLTVNTGSSLFLPANSQVEFFRNNFVGACPGAGCEQATVDGTGTATALLPSTGWFAYRVVGVPSATGNAPRTTIAYNRTQSADVQLYVGANTWAILTSVVFSRPAFAGSIGVIGSVHDCTGHSLENARVAIYRGDELVTSNATGQPWLGYMVSTGAIPSSRYDWTDDSGQFVAGSLLPEGPDLRFEVSARLHEDGPEVVIACEEMLARADEILSVVMAPLHSGYAAGSPCASYDTAWARP